GGGYTSDDVVVTVNNVAPTASAGADQTSSEGSLVTLSGSGSDASAADTLFYSWQLLSSTNGQSLPTGNAATYAFTPVDNGVYTLGLTVWDDDGGVSTDDVVVTVSNVAPTAGAGADQTASEGSSVMLAGAGSDAGSADVLSYSWHLVSS